MLSLDTSSCSRSLAGTYSSCTTETLYPLGSDTLSNHYSAFCFCEFLLDASFKWFYAIFVLSENGFFHLALGPQVSSMWLHTAGFHFFLKRNPVLYHIFFIHSSINGHLACFRILAIVNDAAVNTVCRSLFQILIAIFFGHTPEVGFRHEFYFSFQPCQWHVKVPHPGIEPMPQQQP